MQARLVKRQDAVTGGAHFDFLSMDLSMHRGPGRAVSVCKWTLCLLLPVPTSGPRRWERVVRCVPAHIDCDARLAACSRNSCEILAAWPQLRQRSRGVAKGMRSACETGGRCGWVGLRVLPDLGDQEASKRRRGSAAVVGPACTTRVRRSRVPTAPCPVRRAGPGAACSSSSAIVAASPRANITVATITSTVSAISKPTPGYFSVATTP